jgi:hypothetical protein
MKKFCYAIVALCGLYTTSAAAQNPAALVEDVTAKNAGVDFMDYVSAGKKIKLAAGEVLVLGYLNSCIRETITGGTVTIAADRSKVVGGKVERQTVRCDAGKLKLSNKLAAKAGAMVFRRAPRKAKSLPEAQRTLYGTAPVLIVPGGGTVIIDRLDTPGERLEIKVAAKQLRSKAFHDLALDDKALTAGGLYRATTGSRQIVFKVDAAAAPGRGPLVARLLQFKAK